MQFQNVLCIGDSQTYPARSYIGYPEGLALHMNKRTKLTWNCFSEGVNGETLIEIMHRTQRLLKIYEDTFIVCLLAGTNDCRMDKRTNPVLFGEMYKLLVNMIRSKGCMLFVGTIPLIQDGFGHIPYDVISRAHRELLNVEIRSIVKGSGNTYLVDTSLDQTGYVDSVHFNDGGCMVLGRKFGEKILEVTDGKKNKNDSAVPEEKEG